MVSRSTMTFFPFMLSVALNFVPGILGQSGPLIPEHGVASVKAANPSAAEKSNMVSSEPLLASASGNMPNYQQAGRGYSGYQGESGGYDSGYGPGTSGGCYGRPAGYYGDADYDCKTFKVSESFLQFSSSAEWCRNSFSISVHRFLTVTGLSVRRTFGYFVLPSLHQI